MSAWSQSKRWIQAAMQQCSLAGRRLTVMLTASVFSLEEVKLEGGSAVLVHRHQGEFFVTSPACSHYGAPLRKGVSTAGGRGPSVDGIAVYKSEVKDGELFAQVPSEIATGGKHQKVLKTMAKRKSSDRRCFVLLGGGCASLAAAETLRQEGFTGRIVMVTKENHLLQLRSESFYKDYDIEVVKGATVTKLNTKDQTVFYTSEDLKNIFTLRTPEDAANIAALAKKGQKMIVVGGSFIGMEVASSLAKKGCDVAVIAMETVPFERVLGKKVGASFARKLQKEGRPSREQWLCVEWFGTSQVRLFRGNEVVNGVEFEDGEVLPADAVVVGAGVLPNTRFVEGLSLDTWAARRLVKLQF
eukprot:Skav225177  [mRNA]  locus=scaffold1095:375061:388472:- [translate_table: standard]